MAPKFTRVGGLILVVCLCATSRAANDASKAFGEAKQLVAKGDLQGAKKALVSAVKMDRDNQEYLQQYLLVSQAIKLQQAVKTQKDPKRWESAAQSLSLFYTSQGLYALALPVDEAIFKRLGTTDAAVQLAETSLSLNDTKRAVDVLRRLAPNKVTTASQALLCIALVRQDDEAGAKRVVSDLQIPSKADPFTLYLVSRAQAAVGEDGKSLQTLVRCYQSVPPSRLDALKSHTKLCSEFSGIVSTAGFAQVLKTESTVPESKCSGGSSCSSCPMRGNCSHGK